MVVQWKGWGWTVFFVPIALLFVVFGALIFSNFIAPGPDTSDRLFHQMLAAWLLLSGGCVYAIDRWLEGRAKRQRSIMVGPVSEVIRNDEFLYMRMWAWPYVLLILGVAALVTSLFE